MNTKKLTVALMAIMTTLITSGVFSETQALSKGKIESMDLQQYKNTSVNRENEAWKLQSTLAYRHQAYLEIAEGRNVKERQEISEKLSNTAEPKEIEQEEKTNGKLFNSLNNGVVAYVTGLQENSKIKPEADVSIREYISAINGVELKESNSREPKVDTSELNQTIDGNKQKTAIYNHTKKPLITKIGDKVTYTIRIYNEGDVATYVKQVQNYFPSYITYIEPEESKAYWIADDEYGFTFKTTEYCEIVNAGGELNFDEITDKKLVNVLIPPAKKNDENGKESYTLSYVDIQITGEIMRTAQYGKPVTNLVEVTKIQNEKGKTIIDRDSSEANLQIPADEELPTYKNELENEKYVQGQEDDDDFEKVVVQEETLDLALRKFVTKVNDIEYNRVPEVDTTALKNSIGTTAEYKHNKEPIIAKAGDRVTYTIRIYNEGEKIGSVAGITDYTSKLLKIVQNENTEQNVDVAENQEMQPENPQAWFQTEGEEYNSSISTEFCKVTGVGGKVSNSEIGKNIKDVIIPAYDKENDILSYIDVNIEYEVQPTEEKTVITSITEISKELNERGEELLKDKDSIPNGKLENETIPNAKELEEYKDNEILEAKEYIPGYEDDDDFEKICISPDFDLSIKNFISQIGITKVNNREPRVIYKDDKITYEQLKAPIGAKPGDTIIYTIRVFNEGKADGYAEEIIDNIPEGLEYIADNEINKQYKWKMLDENEEETREQSEAKHLVTDYLSKAQEQETGRENKIKAFKPSEESAEVQYKDIQLALNVAFVPQTQEEKNKVIMNAVQISKDSDNDIDSEPTREEEYAEDGENQDDIDAEKIKTGYFDLSIQKWVKEARVTLKGKTTVIEGNTVEESKNEPTIKVEIEEKNINKIIVKFQYMIRVNNEGNIQGYADEIADYIPEGFKFEESDNVKWGWKIGEDGIVRTDYLKDTELKPGSYAEVPIVLVWKNGIENLGEKINKAEISKTRNESNATDIDSILGNMIDEEDDLDDSSVVIAAHTGTFRIYIGLTMIMLIAFAGGIFVMKKYVLE